MLGWILSSATAKKIAPRLIEYIKERRIIQEFRIGRVGAAAAATSGCSVEAFLAHLGARRKITKAMHGRIARALEAYGPLCSQWRSHMQRCELVFWEAPADAPAPHAERESLHHARRRLSNACQRPAALFDFLLRSPRLVPPVKFCVPSPEELRKTFRDELARPELLYSAPSIMPSVSISHGLCAAPRTKEYLIRFPSPSRFVNDTVYARVIEPDEPQSDAPALIYCGPFGMAYDQLTNWPEEKYLARPLAQQGCRIIMLEAPWHGRRTPAGYSSGEYFLAASPGGCISFLSAQVQEISVIAGWLRKLWNCPVAVAGMSLGGMAVQQMTAWCHTWPAELRPDAVLLCASGFYPERILANSSLSRGLGIYRAVSHAGWKKEDFEALGHLFQPGVRPCIEPGRIMAVFGRYDKIVPYAYGREMAGAWSVPAENSIVWDTGHIGVLTDMVRTPQGSRIMKRALTLAQVSRSNFAAPR
jgi:pimeloyl-ACP methyl ester carboxylesterase